MTASTSVAAQPAPAASPSATEPVLARLIHHVFGRRPELPALIVAAFLTRLWSVTWPNKVIFDETYFKTDAGKYMTGQFFFDPHPPLGKELLALWAWIAQQDPAGMADNQHPNPVVRYLPAFAGALIVPVVWALARQLGGSRRVAFLAGLAVLLDGALIVESRFALLDSMLILFGLTGISMYIAANSRVGWRYWTFVAGSGLFTGASLSTKWTGATSLAIVGLLWAICVIRRRSDLKTLWRRHVISGIAIPLLALSVYVVSFAIHFALLTDSGGVEDTWMSPAFQQTLVGNGLHDPQNLDYKPSMWWEQVPDRPIDANTKQNPYYTDRGSGVFADAYWLFHDILDATRGAQQYEEALKDSTHTYGSKWNTWPVMNRDIYFAAEPGGRSVYLLGNPVVWWGAVAGMAFVLIGMLFRFERFKPWLLPMGVLLFAYLINWLPFSKIVRVMFLYHYLFALICSILLVSIGIGAFFGWEDDGTFLGKRSKSAADRSPTALKGKAKSVARKELVAAASSRPPTNDFGPVRDADGRVASPPVSRLVADIGDWVFMGTCVAIAIAFFFFSPLTYGLSLDDGGMNMRMWLSSWR